MNTEKIKLSVITIKTKGVLMILLGMVHTIVAYFEYENIKNEMSEYLGIQYILWFIATGVFLLFLGLIDVLASKKMKSGDGFAYTIALVSSIFTTFFGLTGIVGLSFELSPTYLIFIFGVVSLFVLVKNKTSFKI